MDCIALVSRRLSPGPEEREGRSRASARYAPGPTMQAMRATGKASPVFSPT
jgi:hypothetical protein